MTDYNDYPFNEVCAQARAYAEQGFNVYQKFTCSGCGNRLTIEEPNKFYETGSCDNCSTITNIREKGCNYMLHKALTEKGRSWRP